MVSPGNRPVLGQKGARRAVLARSRQVNRHGRARLRRAYPGVAVEVGRAVAGTHRADPDPFGAQFIGVEHGDRVQRALRCAVREENRGVGGPRASRVGQVGEGSEFAGHVDDACGGGAAEQGSMAWVTAMTPNTLVS